MNLRYDIPVDSKSTPPGVYAVSIRTVTLGTGTLGRFLRVEGSKPIAVPFEASPFTAVTVEQVPSC